MLDPHQQQNVRRLAGLAEPEIREQATVVAVASIERTIDDQVDQETWLAEIRRGIDQAIEKTRADVG